MMGPLYILVDNPYKHDNHTVDDYTIPKSIGRVGCWCWLWHAAPCLQSPLKIGAEIGGRESSE